MHFKFNKIIQTMIVLIVSLIIVYYNAYSNNFPSDLSKEDINALKAGNSIIKKYKQKTQEGEMARVVGAILIQKPVEEVWKCILDWEHMSHYVDGLDYYKVLTKINGTTSVIEGQIHVTFLKFRYTLIVQNQKNNYFQKWRLLSDDDIKLYNITNHINPHSSGIRNIEGYQYCISMDDNTTLLYYAPVVEVSVPVPGFVENSLTKKSIKDYLYGIKNYLENGK
ncbi:MAG: hypothetical protein AB1444_01715 [Spirochaetota bacterium]